MSTSSGTVIRPSPVVVVSEVDEVVEVAVVEAYAIGVDGLIDTSSTSVSSARFRRLRIRSGSWGSDGICLPSRTSSASCAVTSSACAFSSASWEFK
jgi:hypothetical protein